MVEVTILTVVVVALLAAGIWYLLVRRSAAADSAARAHGTDEVPAPEQPVAPVAPAVPVAEPLAADHEPAADAEPVSEPVVEAEPLVEPAPQPAVEVVTAPEADLVGLAVSEPAALVSDELAPELVPDTAGVPEVEAEVTAAVSEPELAKPEPVEPELVEPEVVEPEVVEPEPELEPELVEPEVVEPEVAELEVVEPEPVERKLVEPEVAEPEAVEPAVVEPSASEPEPVEPEVVPAPAAEPDEAAVLRGEAVRLAGTATDKEEAIAEVGALLVATGAVEPAYVDSMLARERSVSTFMGNLLAIPHGTAEGQALIHRSAIAVVRYPRGIEWNGNSAHFVVGIAGADDDHVRILSGIAGIFLDSGAVAELSAATSVAEVLAIFAPVNEAA